jgi:DNA-binding CsgD family transcriptional regulator
VELPATLVRARLETGYGRFLLTHGERRPALDLLRGAHEKLERLRATPFLAVCDALLQTAGLRPAGSGGASLDFTHQELAVARLAAAGRTNSEVGRELFITSRTVAFHLSNIYAKAGIASRRELAGRFPDLLG